MPTKRFDRQFPALGRTRQARRINVYSGTSDPKLFRQLNAMLDALYPRRLDVLAAIRDGRLHPLVAFEQFASGRLTEAPSVAHTQPLVASFVAWAQHYEKAGRLHRAALLRLFRLDDRGAAQGVLTPFVHAGATVADAADVLRHYREHAARRNIARQFNLVRAYLAAFLRSTVGRDDAAYRLLVAVETLPVTPKFSRHPLMPLDALAVRAKLGGVAGAIWWSLCVTGMNPLELWGRWELDRAFGAVRIFGTKRPGRSWGDTGRLVPLIDEPVVPTLTYWGFVSALRRARVNVTPKSGRDTFTLWLQEAHIPRTRRRLYLGHGAKDVTDIYETHEVKAFLAEDRARLLALPGLDALPGLRVLRA